MLGRILVALDGSPLAESALSLAGIIARKSGATMVLVQAVPTGETLEVVDPANPNVLRFVAPTSTSATDQVTARESMHQAREYLEAHARDLHNSGVKVETAVIPGEPADVLIDEAKLRHASLLVMSTHGRSGLGRWLYGSVAEAVIARTSVPVLLVRSGIPSRGLAAEDGMARLLVTLDGSSTAEKALPAASELAHALDAEVFLLRIVPSAPVSSTREGIRFGGTQQRRPSDSYEREAEAYLDRIAARLRATGLHVSTAVASDHPPAGIVAAAGATGAAIIVMATHARTGLGRAILGSVALDVLRHGTQPVVLVRPTNEAVVESTEAVSAQ